MKIKSVAIGASVRLDQHPETPVIHKIGGYGSGSDISRELDASADTWDRQRTNELLYEAFRDQVENGNIA